MTSPMSWEQVCALGLSLPDVEVSLSYRTPALKVRGKAFVRLKEDGETLVFLLESVDEQELLIQARPELYYLTDHYRGWPAVLARLATLDAAECRRRLEQGWRLKAPRKLVKELEAARQPEAAGSCNQPLQARV